MHVYIFRIILGDVTHLIIQVENVTFICYFTLGERGHTHDVCA